MSTESKKRDPWGKGDYDAELCQRVVSEFPKIIKGIWQGSCDLDKIRDRGELFKGLVGNFAHAFGDVLLFVAEALPPEQGAGRRQRFKIVAWHPEGAPRKWWRGFHSETLDAVLTAPNKTVLLSNKDFRGKRPGPLERVLGNLAVTRVWFYGQNTLCIGISSRVRSVDVDPFVGCHERVLKYFPELLATPLRLENEYLETRLFSETCEAGIPEEVALVGEGILRPRVQLAWRSRAALQAEGDRRYALETAPRVSGAYDALFAQYLDGKRFVVARAPEIISDAFFSESVNQFARLFDPRDDNGRVVLTLYATHDQARSKDDSFALGGKAVLSRHATARALFWLGYKGGVLPWGDGQQRKCRFAAREHNECSGDGRCLKLVGSYARTEAKTPENEPAGVYTSWLRCLWVEVYYRARWIREHRGEQSGEALKELAERYKRAAEATGTVFQDALYRLPKRAHSPQIDWRWMFLWFLSNVTSSQALREQYGVYDRSRHGFRSHLDHYRDASTAMLFGLHLLRFWDAPTVPELWDLPEVRPDEVTQARVRLLCDYGYVELGVDRTWKLEHHLGAQFEADLLLQASSSAHRDHTFHVMDVCLLGELLLRSRNPNGTPSSLAIAILGGASKGRLDCVLRRWYPAALLHDIGNALALTRRLPDILEHLSSPDLNEYAESVRDGVDAAHQALDKRIVAQFGSNRLTLAKGIDGTWGEVSRDHGVISVNHLIHSLNSAAGDKGFLKHPEIMDVLYAILRHSRSEEHYSTAKDPLSFFLLLCDHLQEWNRPRVRSKRLAMSLLASAQTSMTFRVERQKSARFLVPSGSYDPGANALKFRKGSPSLELHYSSPQSALLEPVCLWVDTCADFERVAFDRRFPGLRLVFAHPPSEVLARSGFGDSEMGLLRDFAATAEGAFLAEWLEAVGDKPKGELWYGLKRQKEAPSTTTEMFALRLGRRRVGHQRLLSAAPADFYTQFSTWKEKQLRLAPEED